jgi:hypothetical protein
MHRHVALTHGKLDEFLGSEELMERKRTSVNDDITIKDESIGGGGGGGAGGYEVRVLRRTLRWSSDNQKFKKLILKILFF